MSHMKYVVAAIGAVGVLLMSVGSVQADTSSQLAKCRYGSKAKTVSCCEAVIRKAGKKPMWMRQSHRDCKSAVVCYGGGAEPYCYVQQQIWPNTPGDGPHELHQTPHSPNSPTHG